MSFSIVFEQKSGGRHCEGHFCVNFIKMRDGRLAGSEEYNGELWYHLKSWIYFCILLNLIDRLLVTILLYD